MKFYRLTPKEQTVLQRFIDAAQPGYNRVWDIFGEGTMVRVANSDRPTPEFLTPDDEHEPWVFTIQLADDFWAKIDELAAKYAEEDMKTAVALPVAA